MEPGGEVMRIKLEVEDSGESRDRQESAPGEQRRYDPRQRRQQEAQADKAEELRKQRMRARGRGRVGTRERASDEAFVSRRTKPLQELRDKYAERIRDLYRQTRVEGPWRPGEKEALSDSLLRTRAEAYRRVNAVEQIDRTGREMRLADARKLARSGASVPSVSRAGQAASALARGGVAGALRAGIGTAARVAGPAAAAYLAARTAANAAPGIASLIGGASAGQSLQGPAREIASLEAGVTSYIESFEKANELREAALLLGGDLGGDAYSLPLRSELASIGRKQKEFQAYLQRQKAIRINAAAGDLWRDALFGDKSMIASITGQRRQQ